MSIHDEIKTLEGNGRLFKLRPMTLLPQQYEIRKLYVSEEIYARIIGPWPNKGEEFRSGRVHADLLAFTYRDPVVLARNPRQGGASYMSRLMPPDDEVWDVRCIDPKPGIRVLGRFADRNLFIGLTWEVRLSLKDFGSREWKDAIIRCAREWRQLFPAYNPLMGDYFADYISEGVFDRDP
jgi:hypothetical protein